MNIGSFRSFCDFQLYLIEGQMPEADGDEIMKHLKDFNVEFDLVMAKVSIINEITLNPNGKIKNKCCK